MRGWMLDAECWILICLGSRTSRQPRKFPHVRSHSIRPQSDRLSAHRRRADGALQLAVCQRAGRAVHPADRRHRCAAKRRRSAGADSARAEMGRARLGRRPGRRRPVRALLPVAATGTISGGRRAAARGWGRLSRLRHDRRTAGRARSGPTERADRLSTAAAGGRKRTPTRSGSKRKAGRASCGC